MKTIEENLNEIGLRLKEIRKLLNLTQRNIAEAAGISDGAVSEIEAGNMKPSSKLLFYLAVVHNVNINYVLTGVGGMFAAGVDFSLFDEEDKIKDLLRLMLKKKSMYHSVMAVYYREVEH